MSVKMNMKTEARWLPLTAGLLFAIGLAVSGMTQPAKVVGFLDFFGDWDPSLAFVMLGAGAVYFAVHRGLVSKRPRPFYGDRFWIPPATKVDLPLVGGAAIFGVGWGLSGFCPGPALVAAGAGATGALWFVPAVVAGMLLHAWLARKPATGGDG